MSKKQNLQLVFYQVTHLFHLCWQGAATVTEFYAKNSRWTEGLISASKAVGWGATQLL